MLKQGYKLPTSKNTTNDIDKRFNRKLYSNPYYSKIYSSKSLVFPPLKKLFLSAIFVCASIESYKKWKKHKKLMTINSNSTIYWNVQKTLMNNYGGYTSFFNYNSKNSMTFLDIIQTLEEIKNDDRINGFVTDLSTTNEISESSSLGFAQIQELKDALEELKEIKKKRLGDKFKMMACTDTFDNQAQYYLATSFDEIHIEPTGMIPLTGFSISQPFFKTLLDRMGIITRYHNRNEYKSINSSLTSTEFNSSQKKNLIQLYTNLTRQLAEGIAKGRENSMNKIKIIKNSNWLVSLIRSSKLVKSGNYIEDNTEKVMELINQGPYSANEAIKFGLVDKLSYRRQTLTSLKKENKENTLSLNKYHIARTNEIRKEKRKVLSMAKKRLVPNHVGIGLINISDNIVRGNSLNGSNNIIKSIVKAGYDKNTEAIVLRIDSGGGDYGASDSIWEAVKFVQDELKKPVVASFGNTAASGAYYIASACEKILASTGTLTGSIGVASIRPVITPQFLKMFGITVDEIHITDGSKYDSIFQDFDSARLEKFIKHVNEAYETFKARVMDGRKMSLREIDEVAGGQLWTGFDATSNGLVDKIGGLNRSIQEAAHIALSKRDSDTLSKSDKRLIQKYKFLKNSEEPSIEIFEYQKPNSFMDFLNNNTLDDEIFNNENIVKSNINYNNKELNLLSLHNFNLNPNHINVNDVNSINRFDDKSLHLFNLLISNYVKLLNSKV